MVNALQYMFLKTVENYFVLKLCRDCLEADGLGFFSDSKGDEKNRPQPCTSRRTETDKVKQETLKWNTECKCCSFYFK